MQKHASSYCLLYEYRTWSSSFSGVLKMNLPSTNSCKQLHIWILFVNRKTFCGISCGKQFWQCCEFSWKSCELFHLYPFLIVVYWFVIKCCWLFPTCARKDVFYGECICIFYLFRQVSLLLVFRPWYKCIVVNSDDLFI